MRIALRAKVEAGIAQSTRPIVQQRDWSHITSQIGMFCFTGLSLEQVRDCSYVLLLLLLCFTTELLSGASVAGRVPHLLYRGRPLFRRWYQRSQRGRHSERNRSCSRLIIINYST